MKKLFGKKKRINDAITISIRMPKGLHSQIMTLCKDQQRTKTWMVVHIIEDALREQP